MHHEQDLVVCVELFESRMERNLRDLRRAMLDSNWNAARFVLRRMLSAAVSLALHDLITVIKKAEQKLKHQILNRIQDDLEHIVFLCHEYRTDLRAQLQMRIE